MWIPAVGLGLMPVVLYLSRRQGTDDELKRHSKLRLEPLVLTPWGILLGSQGTAIPWHKIDAVYHRMGGETEKNVGPEHYLFIDVDGGRWHGVSDSDDVAPVEWLFSRFRTQPPEVWRLISKVEGARLLTRLTSRRRSSAMPAKRSPWAVLGFSASRMLAIALPATL